MSDFYYTLDRLIKEEIEKKQKIAIYSLESTGLLAQDIIVNRYGYKCIIIDNYLAQYNQKIININTFEKIDDYTFTIIVCDVEFYSNRDVIRYLLGKKLKAQIRNILEPWNNNISSGVFAKYGIIKRTANNVGLFSYFITFLGGIQVCIEKNLTPVIDMYTYDNIYHKKNKKVNSWELFFEQPGNVRLEEIKDIERETKVIDCDDIPLERRPNLTMDFITNDKRVEYWRKFCKKYIRINESTKCYVRECFNTYFSENQENQTVGVLCRGTDYVNIKPYMHAIQPDIDEMIKKVRTVMKIYGCKFVFLATEDAEIFSKFSSEFSSVLITQRILRYSNTGKKVLGEIEREAGREDTEKKGLDYLSSIYMLSRCKCLVAGRTSGSIGALLLSEGYEYSYIWNLGLYGVDDVKKETYFTI